MLILVKEAVLIFFFFYLKSMSSLLILNFIRAEQLTALFDMYIVCVRINFVTLIFGFEAVERSSDIHYLKTDSYIYI